MKTTCCLLWAAAQHTPFFRQRVWPAVPWSFFVCFGDAHHFRLVPRFIIHLSHDIRSFYENNQPTNCIRSHMETGKLWGNRIRVSSLCTPFGLWAQGSFWQEVVHDCIFGRAWFRPSLPLWLLSNRREIFILKGGVYLGESNPWLGQVAAEERSRSIIKKDRDAVAGPSNCLIIKEIEVGF
jgi:hypothetical protein